MATTANEIDLYKDAATMTMPPVPKSPLRTSKMMDGSVWDGKNPKAFAASFKIKA